MQTMSRRWIGALVLAAACEDGGTLNQLTASGAFAPEALDFGEVTVGSARALPVVLSNTGEVGLDVAAVDIAESFSLRGLKRPLEGAILPPNNSVEIDVVFLPLQEGLIEGSVRLGTMDDDIELPLRGIGTIRMAPDVRANPVRVDFGEVPVGQTDRREILLNNDGTAEGRVVSARLRSNDSDAREGPIYGLDTELPVVVAVAEEGSAIVLRFTPSAAATFGETILLDVDGMREPVELALTGRGRPPLGNLTCQPVALDFGGVQRGRSSERSASCTASGGQVRILSAEASDPTNFGAPNLAGRVVPAGGSIMVPVQFTPTGVLGPREATLTLSFEDAGGRSEARLNLRGRVTEPAADATAIALELTWNTGFTDLDLHLVAPAGALFGPLDCFFANRNPDWGVRGDPTDNCFLDRDVTTGFGPERINMTRAAPGTYRVFVHYFNDNRRGASEAEVRTSLGGQEVGRQTRRMTCNQVWLAGEIDWDGATGSFRMTDTIIPTPPGIPNNCS